MSFFGYVDATGGEIERDSPTSRRVFGLIEGGKRSKDGSDDDVEARECVLAWQRVSSVAESLFAVVHARARVSSAVESVVVLWVKI